MLYLILLWLVSIQKYIFVILLSCVVPSRRRTHRMNYLLVFFTKNNSRVQNSTTFKRSNCRISARPIDYLSLYFLSSYNNPSRLGIHSNINSSYSSFSLRFVKTITNLLHYFFLLEYIFFPIRNAYPCLLYYFIPWTHIPRSASWSLPGQISADRCHYFFSVSSLRTPLIKRYAMRRDFDFSYTVCVDNPTVSFSDIYVLYRNWIHIHVPWHLVFESYRPILFVAKFHNHIGVSVGLEFLFVSKITLIWNISPRRVHTIYA